MEAMGKLVGAKRPKCVYCKQKDIIIVRFRHPSSNPSFVSIHIYKFCFLIAKPKQKLIQRINKLTNQVKYPNRYFTFCSAVKYPICLFHNSTCEKTKMNKSSQLVK